MAQVAVEVPVVTLQVLAEAAEELAQAATVATVPVVQVALQVTEAQVASLLR